MVADRDTVAGRPTGAEDQNEPVKVGESAALGDAGGDVSDGKVGDDKDSSRWGRLAERRSRVPKVFT